MEYEEIGSRLRNARTNCNLTQAQVCEKLKIPKVQSLSSYEKGTTKVPVDTLAKLCSLYGVTTDNIIYGEHSVFPLNNTLEENIRLFVALADILEFPITEQLPDQNDKSCMPYSSYSLCFDTLTYRGLWDFLRKWKRLRDLLNSDVIDNEEYATLLENKLSSMEIAKIETQLFDTPFGKLPWDPTKYL